MVNQGTALSFYFIKETEILIVNLSEKFNKHNNKKQVLSGYKSQSNFDIRKETKNAP